MSLIITERALLRRINRKLRPDWQQVHKTRNWSGHTLPGSLGEYHRLDFNRNFVIDLDVNLEALGRELGVLHPVERMAEGEPEPQGDLRRPSL